MDETLLRLGGVMSRTGIKKSKLYDLIAREEFPAPIKVDGCSLWPKSRIDAWIAERVAASDPSAGN